MGIFTTREFATTLYMALIIIFVFISKKIRPSAVNLIKSACTKKLIIPFLIMLIYAATFVFILTYIPFWNWLYLKDIVIWIIFAGVPVCFNAISKANEEHYFKNMIISNFQFTALVTFFTGTFTFNIFVELLLQPLLAFFILLQTVAETKDEYKPVKKLMNWVISLIGIVILIFTVRNAINSVSDIDFVNITASFCLPIILSLLYLPFAYLFAVSAKYEILFIRMSFKEPTDKITIQSHRWKVIRACKLSYNKLHKFEKEYIRRMYVTMKNTDFESLIKDFKGAVK
jgi:hypothetical protein